MQDRGGKKTRAGTELYVREQDDEAAADLSGLFICSGEHEATAVCIRTMAYCIYDKKNAYFFIDRHAAFSFYNKSVTSQSEKRRKPVKQPSSNLLPHRRDIIAARNNILYMRKESNVLCLI